MPECFDVTCLYRRSTARPLRELIVSLGLVVVSGPSSAQVPVPASVDLGS